MTRFGAAALAFTLAVPLSLAASVSEAKEKQKTKPKGEQQEFLKIGMKDSPVSSYGRTQSGNNKNQGKSNSPQAK